MKAILKMEWNEKTQQWRMALGNEHIQEFDEKEQLPKNLYNCPIIGRFFVGMDKGKPTYFNVEINRRET